MTLFPMQMGFFVFRFFFKWSIKGSSFVYTCIQGSLAMSHKPTTVWDEVQLTGSSFLLIKGPVIHPRYLRFTLIVVIQLVYNIYIYFFFSH